MTPLAKFNAIVLSATTLIMYLIWIIVAEYVTVENEWILVASLLAAMTSYGFYSLLTKILLVIFTKIRLIKKFILGDGYLEGTWVGFYGGNGREIRYIYETYEQSLEDVLISGYSFKTDKSLHGKWKATKPIINVSNKKVIYYYETDMVHNNFNNLGFASFTLEKSSSKKRYDMMQGFSSDLHSAEKILAIEKKVSDEILSDRKELLERAEEIYKQNKDYIPQMIK